jgi:DNA/RNA-binding domain of Phe-tRNA-synthetase-like protein
MLIFQVSDVWSKTYPDSHAGVLVVRDAQNPARHALLEKRREALEEELRARYSGQDRTSLLNNPVLQAYDAYYRRFKKTYHVQLQLESIIFKGKSIPSVAALVEAMFMAELDHLLLTAGHDLDNLRTPLTLEVATGAEHYTLLRGELQAPKAGDMMILDNEGIISSIIYGPDQRTQITEKTRNAFFTVYGPAGIRAEDITLQLEEILDNVRVIAPEARVEMLQVFGGNS